MEYRYNIHNILTIKSDIDLFLTYFQIQEELGNYDVTIKKVCHRDIDKSNFRQIALGLYYSKQSDTIFSDLNVFGIKVFWKISNLLKQNTVLEFSSSYDFFSRYILKVPVSSVYHIEPLIKMILQIKLLQKNSLFLAGGAVSFSNKGIILTGTYGSGKTSLTLAIMDNFNIQFLGDDLIILSQGKIYSFPSLIKIRKHNFTQISMHQFLDVSKKYKGRVLKMFENDVDIFFLERFPVCSIETLSKTEGINKLCNINNKIIPYFNERLLSFTSYMYGNSSFMDMQQKQYDLIYAFSRNVHFYILCANTNTDYLELIKKKYSL